MRYLRSWVAVALLVLAAGAGCETSPTRSETGTGGLGSGGSGGGTLPNGSMSATFDGATWTASLALAPLFVSETFALSGTDQTGRSLTLSMRASGSGTYPFTGTNGGACNLIIGSATWLGAPAAQQGSGQIVFTTLNATNAIGTFECSAPPQAGTTASGIKSISNGTFNVRF